MATTAPKKTSGIPRKPTGKTQNTQLAGVIDDAKKEKEIPLHVLLPESLMTRLRVHAATKGVSLRSIIIELLEKRV
jgi:predicted DNA binding CopG/RHH family protein